MHTVQWNGMEVINVSKQWKDISMQKCLSYDAWDEINQYETNWVNENSDNDWKFEKIHDDMLSV